MTLSLYLPSYVMKLGSHKCFKWSMPILSWKLPYNEIGSFEFLQSDPTSDLRLAVQKPQQDFIGKREHRLRCFAQTMFYLFINGRNGHEDQ